MIFLWITSLLLRQGCKCCQPVFLYFVVPVTRISKIIFMCIIPMMYSLLIQMHWSQWPQSTLASPWPSHVFSPIWTTGLPESSGTNRVWVILWSWSLRWWKRLKIPHLNEDFLPHDLQRAATQPRALWPFQRRLKKTRQRITAVSQPGVRICGVVHICLLKVIRVTVALLWRKYRDLFSVSALLLNYMIQTNIFHSCIL